MTIVTRLLFVVVTAFGCGASKSHGPPPGALPPKPAANAPKRTQPPALTPDTRPIEYGRFTGINPRHPTHGEIHASEDGGCHVYVRAGGATPPPGWFPPPSPIECPADMLAPEWGHCTGAGSISAIATRNECICNPGEGDPPLPAFRIPCPR